MPFAKINGIELYYEVNDFTRPWEGEAETAGLAPRASRPLVVVELVSGGRSCPALPGRHARPAWPRQVISNRPQATDRDDGRRSLPLVAPTCGGARCILVGHRWAAWCRCSLPWLTRTWCDSLRVGGFLPAHARCDPGRNRALDRRYTKAKGYATVMETFNDDYAAALFSPHFRGQHPDFPSYETKLVLDNLMPDAAFIGCCRAIQQFNVDDRSGGNRGADADRHVQRGHGLRRKPAHAQTCCQGRNYGRHPMSGTARTSRFQTEFNQRVLEFLSQCNTQRQCRRNRANGHVGTTIRRCWRNTWPIAGVDAGGGA